MYNLKTGKEESKIKYPSVMIDDNKEVWLNFEVGRWYRSFCLSKSEFKNLMKWGKENGF